eukprot:TRINITY_DN67086_c0_g1_i1.p1 TRINITY_DN67086_c0_g1~~TRINITY_DN67086_c0_g1_i1.p1  ORF type:complete len:254 (+),score=60.77 TRINITY_DN67086_c0_g1_i1:94-762(+)
MPSEVAVAGANAAAFGIQLVSHYLGVPCEKWAPDLLRYLGRVAYLTYQTNVMGTCYCAAALQQAWLGAAIGDSPWLRRLFPLVFGLSSFVTVAYYALEHFNPVTVQGVRYWEKHGYPSMRYVAHSKHVFALPVVVVQAVTWRGPAPSLEEGLPYIAAFMTWYVGMTHVNKWATGLWIYPVTEAVEKKYGTVGRCSFFGVLAALCAASASAGAWLAQRSAASA